ncbi:MAG: AAA family ATPase [Polyangia bacterium]
MTTEKGRARAGDAAEHSDSDGAPRDTRTLELNFAQSKAPVAPLRPALVPPASIPAPAAAPAAAPDAAFDPTPAPASSVCEQPGALRSKPVPTPRPSLPAPPAPLLDVVNMASVQPERVEWLWHRRIARGCITVLDGDPGLGKSTLVCELAACLSVGRPLPGQSEAVRADVLIINAEDNLSGTIRERLVAADADMERVKAIPNPALQLPEAVPSLEATVRACGVGLVVLDPLMAFASPKVNTFKDQDVRRMLAPLASMADRLGVAVLLVRHPNKAVGGPALYRGGGSIGIIGAARTGLVMAPDPDEPTRRVLAVSKSNLALRAPSLRFGFQSVGTVARIEWLGECEHDADRLLGPPPSEESRSALEDACDFLSELLASGPLPQSEVRERARQEGIKQGTLKRAKRKLGVESEKELGERGKWIWSLLTAKPSHAPLAPLAPLERGSVGERS